MLAAAAMAMTTALASLAATPAAPTVVPPAPTVQVVEGQPAEYVEGEWAGGIGLRGKFVFTSDDSTVGYRYSFDTETLGRSVATDPDQPDGASRPVRFVPRESGPVQLFVAAVDETGHRGPRTVHTFHVLPGAETGTWFFNEGAGDVAEDASELDRSLQLSPSTTWTSGVLGSALLLDEPGDVATSGRPLVRVDRGFTVSARVRVDDADATGTAVSQDGAVSSGFELGYVADARCGGIDAARSGCFAFSMATSGSEPARVLARRPVDERSWYTIIGVHNPLARPGKELVIYTCAEGSGSWDRSTGSYAAHRVRRGDFRVGEAQVAGGTGHSWHGAIDTVRITAGPIGGDSVTERCYSSLPGRS